MKPECLRTKSAGDSMFPEPRSINGKRKYGDLEVSQLKKLKELEEENAKLKKMYANLALDNEILREVIEKKL